MLASKWLHGMSWARNPSVASGSGLWRKSTRILLETLEDRSLPAAFTPGNLVIYRVGDGANTLTNTGNAVFLDEYTTAGVLVQSVPMPTTASGSNVPFIASGTATSEGS